MGRLIVEGEDLQPRGRRFEYWRRILDGMYIEEKEMKVAKWGTPK